MCQIAARMRQLLFRYVNGSTVNGEVGGPILKFLLAVC